MTALELSRIVRSGAESRIAEVQPEFELGKLARYIENPNEAPPISGRVADRLLDLAVLDLIDGRNSAAWGTVRLVRARAKNRNLAFVGTTLLSELARRNAGADPTAMREAIAEVLRELPASRLTSSTVVFQMYQTQPQLDARVQQTHEQLLTPETASAELWFSQVMPDVVRNREHFLAAVERVKGENDARPARADHVFSTVDLSRARDAREVVVAVWDLGTSPSLFQRQLFTNAPEAQNGRDDDGNGQVDDRHGIVSDGAATHMDLLYDPGRETVEQYAPYLQGVMDLRAGMASTPAAQRVLEILRSVEDARALDALELRLVEIGEWAHGTHVASLLLAGNPMAKMAVFRSAWAGEARVYRHRGPTDAELRLERQNMDAIADFIRRHNVRVVNASLGFTTEYLEDELRHESQRYPTDDAVRARAKAVLDIRRANWGNVFAACPNTLFVVAAGNDNHDVVEYGDISASIAADNVMAVGAVDRYGDWAPFTNSNPERVRIFDFGLAVPGLVPTGQTVPLSGTSMAAPNAANLAAKLFSLHPGLTPARVISIIEETGEPIAAPFDGRIVHEARAVARARRARRETADSP